MNNHRPCRTCRHIGRTLEGTACRLCLHSASKPHWEPVAMPAVSELHRLEEEANPEAPWAVHRSKAMTAFAESHRAVTSTCRFDRPAPIGHNGPPEPIEDECNPKDRMGALKLPTLSVIPSSLILAIGNVMRLGAAKYGRFNWRAKPVKATVYADAALRHLMTWVDGEDIDPESGESHLAHVGACMGILIDAKARGVMVDDRDLVDFEAKTAEEWGSKPAALNGTAGEIIRQKTLKSA